MDVVAKLRYLKISPRKVRLVLGLIRGRDLPSAERQLQYLPKSSSHPLMKLLKSAEANAVNNFKLDPKTLYIKQAFADEGPKVKRYQPHAMGRATVIMKRSSHVTVVLVSKTAETPSPKKQHEEPASKQLTKQVKSPSNEPKVAPAAKERKPDSRRSFKNLSRPGEKAPRVERGKGKKE